MSRVEPSYAPREDWIYREVLNTRVVGDSEMHDQNESHPNLDDLFRLLLTELEQRPECWPWALDAVMDAARAYESLYHEALRRLEAHLVVERP